MMKKLIGALIVILLAGSAYIWTSQEAKKKEALKAEAKQLAADKQLMNKVLESNAMIAYAAYTDAVDTAEALSESILQLIAQPSNDNLAQARQAWLAAREPYGQLEAYRFRSGPIDALQDNGVMGGEGDGPEGRINAWPLAEALIDYVAAGAADGVVVADAPVALKGNVIADAEAVPELSADMSNTDKLQQAIDRLIALNEANGDEANVATGYHAIEFLLWGQDLNAGQTEWTHPRDNQAGQRPYTDFIADAQCTSGQNNTVDAAICKRRGNYLVAVTQLLINDLKRLKVQWNIQQSDSYVQQFIQGGEASLTAMLEAMGRLSFGELAGERMNIALTQDSQEDEHSCFSDNTHRDVLLNALGIQNTYLGRYLPTDNFNSATTVEGAGIDGYLRAKGLAANADKLQTALQTSLSALQKIDDRAKAGMPFDLQIAGGELSPKHPEAAADVRAAIQALVAQTAEIQAVIDALQLNSGDLKQDTEENI